MATDTLQLLGKTIAEKYAVESVVGEGGFATVYKAMHLIWKRPVALKVFKALGDFTEKDRAKLLDEFVQEGALLADLSARSAAIVQARDIGTLTGPSGEVIPYMVLEWLEGGSLEQVIADEKARGLPFRTMPEALHLLEPAAEALALAHRKGIAHRDVKPGNVFVIGDPRGDCTVKLLDFGIAKVVNDMQKMAGTFTKTSGQITSFTPAYGAPEQFSRTHGATGPWTDVFALALIFAEVCTGHEPLQGDDFVQLAVASGSTERRPTPRTLGAQVSDAVEAVFLKALAVKPTERWQSAGEFWNALRQAMQMAPIRSATDPMPPRSAPATGPEGFVGAATVAATSDPQPPAAVATLPRAPGAGSSKAGLWATLIASAIILIGGALYLIERRPHTGSPAASSTAPIASEAPSTSASVATKPPPPKNCPDGMIKIPGGSYFMGADDQLPLEKPAHEVVLDPFCMDEFEVTVEQYKKCSDSGRCKRAGTTNDFTPLTDKDRKAFDPLCNILDPVAKATHPINCVDWTMSEKFCHERGKRLPTEAEWEFAARGPDGRKYPWGDDDPASAHLNACGKECVAWGTKNGVEEKAMYDVDDGFPNTAPVGSFPKGASRYGVKDVVGNVWEWVADYFGEYSKDEQTNPKGPETGEARVIRGGSWNASYPAWVRPTFRFKAPESNRSYGIGFRCAK